MISCCQPQIDIIVLLQHIPPTVLCRAKPPTVNSAFLFQSERTTAFSGTILPSGFWLSFRSLSASGYSVATDLSARSAIASGVKLVALNFSIACPNADQPAREKRPRQTPRAKSGSFPSIKPRCGNASSITASRSSNTIEAAKPTSLGFSDTVAMAITPSGP